MDETNGDAFIVILGPHNIVHGRGGDQSVPYCKISMKEPDQSLWDILEQECEDMMYLDEDADCIQEQDGLKLPPFSQPPSP
jgi:hypothetical protein